MAQPFRTGLFEPREKGVALLTSCCASCGQSFFPRRQSCLKCGGATRDAEAGPDGRLFSFSTVHMPTVHFKPPYSVGLIEFADGLRVFSPISETGDQKFAVGMPMRARPRVLWAEESGEVDGFEFIPA
ncbi:Zn-ribbon domain-containing OB-fold protein [Paraburkholderia sp. HP33-1]|uniref:Zn-ribbon domain-containing OB-fold protein n=1 Tax=Paraburkholderia sp. HP33-1 TaxID=2883243 RepID=UPI001F1F1361|nr:OB-fold domain-containing protein [Paraburkholderia sp. HP33-1]